MVVEVREAQPADYDTVCDWWKGHGWTPVLKRYLSKTGLIVTVDGEPAAAVWLYRTDSPVLIAEWLVTDPSLGPKTAYVAVHRVLAAIKDVADMSGCHLMTFLQTDSLIKNFRKQGFLIEEKPYQIAHYERAE